MPRNSEGNIAKRWREAERRFTYVEQDSLLMLACRWILVVDPEVRFREVAWEESSYCRAAGYEVVCVSYANEMVREITTRGMLPEILIVEWMASGTQIRSACEDLQKCGVLRRIHTIAVTGEAARKALGEAQALGITRFICKRPDETAYRAKISDALKEKIPSQSGQPLYA